MSVGTAEARALLPEPYEIRWTITLEVPRRKDLSPGTRFSGPLAIGPYRF